MSLTSRQKRPLNRNIPHLRDTKLIIIVAEGTNTEKLYFESELFKCPRIQVKVFEIQDNKSAPKIYKQFVEKGMGGDLENPFLKVYGGSILGERSFIKQALNTLKEGVISRKETSHTGMMNGQIGQIFNDLSFSAVSKAFQREAKVIKENRAMRKKVNKIISTLSQFKG